MLIIIIYNYGLIIILNLTKRLDHVRIPVLFFLKKQLDFADGSKCLQDTGNKSKYNKKWIFGMRFFPPPSTTRYRFWMCESDIRRRESFWQVGKIYDSSRRKCNCYFLMVSTYSQTQSPINKYISCLHTVKYDLFVYISTAELRLIVIEE